MIQVIQPGTRAGTIRVPASKSTAHRLLIAAALSDAPCRIECRGVSKDIEATARCLEALGAAVEYRKDGAFHTVPIRRAAEEKDICSAVPAASAENAAHLFCGESGTTLRFMLPLAAALGRPAVFHMEGLLSKRPMGPLVLELEKHGVRVHQDGDLLTCEGQLQPGEYVMPGNISSQFISGLLLALPLLNGKSLLTVTNNIESEGYITMTEEVLSNAGVQLKKSGALYEIPGGQQYRVPEKMTVESDWSGAAAFLCMGALSGQGVSVPGMNVRSCHADRAILDVLRGFGAEVTEDKGTVTVRKAPLPEQAASMIAPLHGQVIDASNAPDLVPVLSALACGIDGTTRIVHAERLRLKESDRLKTTAAMLNALGGCVSETDDGLLIRGTGNLTGGEIDPANDHRIAMAAAVAASVCSAPVVIRDSECVGKSYPAFFEDLRTLKTEEHDEADLPEKKAGAEGFKGENT